MPFALLSDRAYSPIRADHSISYLDALMKRGNESIELIMRWGRIMFVESVTHIEDTRLPKCAMFGDLAGGAGCVGRQLKV